MLNYTEKVITSYLVIVLTILPLSKDRLNTRKSPDKVLIVKKTIAQEFFDFLKTFVIIGLAIAFVIGQAASGLVTSL